MNSGLDRIDSGTLANGGIGISVDVAKRVKLVGNVISDDQATPTMNYGIQVRNSENVDWGGNFISGYITGPFVDDGGNTSIRTGNYYKNVVDYGASGNGIANDTAAVQAAMADAEADPNPSAVFFPAGDYIITSDLEVTDDRMSFLGVGDGSLIRFQNAGFHFNGQSGFLYNAQMQDLKIQRDGTQTVGPAVRFSGDGTTGVTRFLMSNVNIDRSSGTALTIDGSFLATFVGCYFRNSTIGIEVKPDSVLGIVGGNALTFVGGECQLNDQAVKLNRAVGVNFQGMTFQGNTLGVELVDRCWGVNFDGCYWEGNGGYDVAIGTGSAGVPRAVSLTGGYHVAATGGAVNSIQLRRCTDFTIATSTFSGYSGAQIAVTEATGPFLSGSIRDIYVPSGTAVDLNGANRVSWPDSVGRGQGTTARRPTGQPVGTQWFDTTLNQPIWFNGTNWIDGSGTVV